MSELYQGEMLDFIYNTIDNMLLKHMFFEVESVLRCVDIKETPVLLTLSLLTITNTAKRQLPYREIFYARVEEHYKNIRPDDWEGLLVGLK